MKIGKMEVVKKYANAIYQNAMVGKQSISDILPKIENEELRNELDSEYSEFESVCLCVEKFADENKIEVEDNNILEKSRMWLSVNMGTLFDKTTRHITQLMLVGTVMGLTTCYKDKYDYKNVNSDLDKCINKLEDILNKNYDNLKKFLKCYDGE